MSVSEEYRSTVRTSLVGLILLQVFIFAWMTLDQGGRFAARLNTALFFLAAFSGLFATYLFKPKLTPLRSAVGAGLIWALLLVSLTSLTLVDYGGLGAAGPLVPIVLLVSIVVAYLRARSG